MAERNERVLERIRQELDNDPDTETRKLHEIATSVDAEIGDLTLRQFNAGYVVPLKRARSATGGGKKRGSAQRAAQKRASGRKQEEAPPRRGREAAPANQREAVRAVLLQFARDFAEAESRSEIVSVVSGLDRYVDRILEVR